MEVISLKSPREVDFMRTAGRIAAAARQLAGEMVVPGTTTLAIDKAVRRLIEKAGATPSFLGYNGFPGSVCISVNEEVIHGIPSQRRLEEGDIVSIDVGACYQGFHGDCAQTFPCGRVSDEALRLIRVTEESFWRGIEKARAGNRVSDISWSVQEYVEENGFSVVEQFVGHGIGRALHEPPGVPNFGKPGRGARLAAGMTLAVEPMVNQGTHMVDIMQDGWTVKTADRRLSAHYENTILITGGGPEVLTAQEQEMGAPHSRGAT